MSSSAALFCFCLQSFLASGSFTISRLFSSGSRSIGASASVLAVNNQGWFSRLLPSIINFPPSSHCLHQYPHSHNINYVRSWSLPKVMLGFPLAHPFLHLHSNFKVVRSDIFLFVQSFIIYFFCLMYANTVGKVWRFILLPLKMSVYRLEFFSPVFIFLLLREIFLRLRSKILNFKNSFL